MSPRRALSASGELTEAAFQAQVIGLARMYGWKVYHAPDNRPAGKTGRPQALAAPEGRGFPDLVMVRGPRLIFAELKTRTGRLGPGQAEWTSALNEVGDAVAFYIHKADPPRSHAPEVGAYIWRPADWERIQHVLGRGQERRVELDPLNAA